MPRKALQRVRWSVEWAASEFPINPRTLSSRIKQLSILPGADGKFSTKEICAAVFGDLEFEKIRKTKAEADQIEMEMATSRRELVPVQEFEKEYQARMVEVIRLVRTSSLSGPAQDALLSAFSGVMTA